MYVGLIQNCRFYIPPLLTNLKQDCTSTFFVLGRSSKWYWKRNDTNLRKSDCKLMVKCTFIKTLNVLQCLQWLIFNWNCFNLHWQYVLFKWCNLNIHFCIKQMSFWLLYGHNKQFCTTSLAKAVHHLLTMTLFSYPADG